MFRGRGDHDDPFGGRSDLVANLKTLEGRVNSLQSDFAGASHPQKQIQSADDLAARRQRPTPIQVVN